MKTNPVFIVQKFYAKPDQWKELGVFPTLNDAEDYLVELFDDIAELLDQEGGGDIPTDMIMANWRNTHEIIQL